MQSYEFPFSITPQETMFDLCVHFHACLRKKSGRQLSKVAAEMFKAWFFAPGMIGDNMVVQKVYPSVQSQLRHLEQEIRENLLIPLDVDCSEFDKLIDIYDAFRKQFKIDLGKFESFVGYNTLIDVWFKLYETGCAPWHLIPEKEVGIDAWLREHNQENYKQEPPPVTGVNTVNESSFRKMLNSAKTYSALPEKPPEIEVEVRTLYDYDRLQTKRMTRTIAEEKVKPQTDQLWIGQGLRNSSLGLQSSRNKEVAGLLQEIDRSLPDLTDLTDLTGSTGLVGQGSDSTRNHSDSIVVGRVKPNDSKVNSFNWTEPELESICIYIQRVYPEALPSNVDDLFRRDPQRHKVSEMCDDHDDLACFVEIYTRQQISLARGDAFFSSLFNRFGGRTLAELRTHLVTLVSRSV